MISKIIRPCIVSTILLLGIADSAICQLTARQLDNKDFFKRVSQFSDISWVSPPFSDIGSPKNFYILSADIQPHFMIGGEKLPFVIEFTPRYKVRIFKNNIQEGDSSFPVRTPSFMPGATVYIPLRKHNPDNSAYKNIKYLSIALFHHSNGQDHRTFKSPGVFNLYNGNFSTQYFEIAFNKNIRTPKTGSNRDFCKPDTDCNKCPPRYDVGYLDKVFKIGIEQHIGTATEQRGSYGRTRINFKGSLIDVINWRLRVRQNSTSPWTRVGSCFLKESFRLVSNISINVDKLQDPYNRLDRRVNIDLGIFKKIASGNTSVFGMVGYYGNDPYNIYYSQHYAFVRIGLALGMFIETSKFHD
jgi:hypothetical protein